MINKTQKKALLKSLGSKPIRKVQDYALANGFVKGNGQEYSRSTFSNSFNGIGTNLPVEKIIFEAADHYHALAEKEKEERKKFVTKVNNA